MNNILVSKMNNYIIVHCKHDGCYNSECFEDNNTKRRIIPITINPPKIFLFNNKKTATDFFYDYMNDVDVIDNRCKQNDKVVHQDYCTCGIIEFDNDGQPNLFYNRINQIFLLENSASVFTTPYNIKKDIDNLNLTNKFIQNVKTLDVEQRNKYIELGKVCEECNSQLTNNNLNNNTIYNINDNIQNSIQNNKLNNDIIKQIPKYKKYNKTNTRCNK